MSPFTKPAAIGLLIASFSTAQQFTEVAQELGVEDSIYTSMSGVYWVRTNNNLDLYVSNSQYLIDPYIPFSNRLYINHLNNSMGFLDEAVALGVDVEDGLSYAAGWADYNMDGLVDLYVSCIPNEFYQNEDSYFSEIGAELGVDVTQINTGANGIAWGDFNNDGRPDIFLTSLQDSRYLFRNEGNYFLDVAIALNVFFYEDFSGVNPAIWGDYDNDGDLDLFIPVPFYPSKLFRNDLAELGQFSEVAVEVGLTNLGSCRKASWVDYDNDGDLDLFVLYTTYTTTQWYSHRNSLFRNDSGQFTNIADSVGLGDSTISMYASWADYDNDGDQDLFITNYINTPDKLYRNDINIAGVFTEVGAEFVLDHLGHSRVCTWGDYDNDGDMDLYVGNKIDYQVPENGLNLLYRNNQDDQNYLKVRFLSANGSQSRHGSRIWVYYAHTDSLVGMRDIDVGSSGTSQNMYDAHFGLDGSLAYDIVIRSTVRINGENIILDKSIEPQMGGVVPVDIGGFIEIRDLVDYLDVDDYSSVVPQSVTLKQNYPNPFNATTTIPFSLSNPGNIQLRIYDIKGQLIHKIERKSLSAGEHQITWDGSYEDGQKISSGIYLYRLETKDDRYSFLRQTKKMVILK
jgi:hypothetical protein